MSDHEAASPLDPTPPWPRLRHSHKGIPSTTIGCHLSPRGSLRHLPFYERGVCSLRRGRVWGPHPLGLAGAGGGRGWPRGAEGGWPRPKGVLAWHRAVERESGDGLPTGHALTLYRVETVWGRTRCSSVQPIAPHCRAGDVSRRHFLRFRNSSNLGVGGSNPSRTFAARLRSRTGETTNTSPSVESSVSASIGRRTRSSNRQPQGRVSRSARRFRSAATSDFQAPRVAISRWSLAILISARRISARIVSRGRPSVL